MDRFIVQKEKYRRYYFSYLKSNMDRFIGEKAGCTIEPLDPI